MTRIEPATIYQIFWLSHNGMPKTEIALRLGLTRDTVFSHLSGRLSHRYPASLRRRISTLSKPPIRQRKIPDGFITIAEASYFFQIRPTVKTILQMYPLPMQLVDRVNYTRKEWVREFVAQKNDPNIEGILMTSQAAKYLYGVKARGRFVRLADFDSSDEPASLIHFALGIMDWTGMPFVTLDMQDVIQFT